MSKKFYITTAIDYANGSPHIGHAYEKVLADIVARYERMKGTDVHFVTGLDEHGQKVQMSAQKAGVAPIEICDRLAEEFSDNPNVLLLKGHIYCSGFQDYDLAPVSRPFVRDSLREAIF